MSKQVLDVQQMQHLQELGLDISNASASWYKPNMGTEYMQTFGTLAWENLVGNEENIPAYTLQDVLDALPYSIECDKVDVYWLQIEKMDMKNDDWRVSYLFFSQCKYFHCFQSPLLIDAAYEMLCWLIEQGYVRTNKKTNEV